MNQKITQKRTKRKNLWSPYKKSKEELLESLINNPNLSDEERFNQYLQVDLRLNSSYTQMDLETERILRKVGDQFKNFYDSMSGAQKAIRDYQQKFFVSPEAALFFAAPLVGFYLANRNVHTSYQYRLPSSMPGLSMVCKKATVMDWSTVVGTQFFHKIDWKDVGVSLYRPDSAFVLFSPRVQFGLQEKYVAFVTTGLEYESTVDYAQATTDLPIDLVKVGKDSYAAPNSSPLEKENLAKRAGKTVGKKSLQLFRKKQKYSVPTMPSVSSEVDNFRIVKSIVHSPNRELKRLPYPRLRLFSLRYFSKPSYRPSYISRPKSAKSLKFPDKNNRVWVGNLEQRLQKFTPIPVLIDGTPKVKQQNVAVVKDLVASRDHHVLMPAEDVAEVERTIQKQLKKKTRNPFLVGSIKSQHYWQTFFTSLDLIPSRMESMTFSNKPKLPTKDQYLIDIKKLEKDTNLLQKAFILPEALDKRDTFEIPKYHEEIERRSKKRLRKQKRLEKNKPLKDAMIRLTPIEKPYLAGFNTNTARREKHALVAPDGHESFDLQHDNPYSVDGYVDKIYHVNMLRKNWENRIRERYDSDVPGLHNEAEKLHIPPLFKVKELENSHILFPRHTIKADTSGLLKQDRPAKIFLLSRAINDNFQKALNTRIAVRQSSRYQIYNSLFHFKNLLGRNYYNRQFPNVRPVEFLPDYILHPDNKTMTQKSDGVKTDGVKTLDGAFLYDVLVRESENFNIFANFPYTKRYEVEKSKNLLYSNNQLTEFESLDRNLKDYVVPLRKAATIKKLRLRRWWYKRLLWFLNFKRYKEVTFSDDQREPKHWSNWEATLKNQTFEEEKVQEFAPPKPSQQDMLEPTLLVGKLDLDNLELYEQKLKNEKTPFEEKAFTTLYNRCFKNYDLTSHQNLDMWQDRKRLKRIKHYFEKRRSYYCKNLMKTLYKLRDVVSKKPVTPTSFDNYSAFKAWEKKKDAYNRKVSDLVANTAKIVRGKAVFEREEKAYAEVLIPVFEKMDYEKDFKVPRRKEAPSFLRTLLPTDDPKRVQSNFISKQIQSDLVDKAMESYYVKNGRFLNKFDVSHHQAILRDFDKASLMTWRYTKDIKDIESSQGLEFYAPLELLDASLKRQLPEQATIQPYADKFNFDGSKKEYRRFLISNPFRVVPNTQKALFTRVSRDIIENEAYQDYLNWYQYFFLRNVHFINPAVKLNQLNHLLEPNKLNAYKAYSKATKEPCWTEDELKNMPFNDEKVYQVLESQKKEAMVDHQETKQRYINQVEKERAYKEEVKKDIKERRRKDDVNAKRQAVQEDGPNGLLLSELMPKEDYDLHPSEIEFLDQYRPDHFHSHRGLTQEEKRELRKTIREAKKLKRKLAKEAKKLAKTEAKEEKRKENELNRLRTPEERRLEKQKKQEAKRKEKQRKKEQKRKEQEAKRAVKRLLKRQQANEKRLKKALAATKNRQLINFSKDFDFTEPEYRQYFVEKYGKTALADVDREMELFDFRDKLIDKKERAASGTFKLSVSHKRKLAALFDKQLPIELRPSEEFDEFAEPEKFAKSKTRQMENLRATETPTYLDFFKENLVYFLSPSKTIDPVYCERLLPDREVRDYTKLHEETTAKFGSDGPVKTEKPDLSEAYKEVAKSFGWAKKTPFDESKQEVTQVRLNREIVNAFIRSQQAFRKSKVQKENEQTIRNKIRNRIVQGHSPYLKRCLSGYLNPDATFQDKFGELAGWDNVFEKVKHIYGLTKSRNTNLFSFAQLAFLQHWGRLSTINSPLYQLTSPSRAYHYECFGRLINRRTSQVLDFQQLNLHSVLKAGNPHRQLIPKYYYGNTTTTLGVPCYPGVPAEEDVDFNIIVDEKAFRKETKRVARGKDVSLEQLLMKQAPVFKETLDPDSADGSRHRRRLIEGGPLGLDGPFKDENDSQAFENYDNYFKYKGDMNHFKESANISKGDDNYQDSDDNYQNSDEETLNVNNDRFYDSDDYNSDDSFDDHLSNPTLKNAQVQTKEEKRKEKLQKREEKRNERFQKRKERKRLKTQKVEMKENPIFDPYDENTARLFNRLKKKYRSDDYELKPDHVNAERYQFQRPDEEDQESTDQLIEDEGDYLIEGGLRPYAGPLQSYPEIATYKARGLPKRIFIEEKSQELIDANALMNKVRHRWFDSQNFESSMSRVIDHSLFDYKYWEDSKWVFRKNLRSKLHPCSKENYPSIVKRICGFERFQSKVVLNVSLTDPSFFSFLIVLWYMAKIAKRVKQDYQRTVYRGLTRFLSKLDFNALRSLTKLNEAIVRCQGIEFNNIVGGEKLLYLFYPLILWNRNKHFSFGTLPVFEYKLLQTLASGSPGFVLNNDKWEFNILKPTKKEIEMSRKLEQARNYMVQIEQQSCLLIGPPGTGKTFLVKALASESYLPVLIPTRYEAIIQLENVESSFENPDETLRMRQIFELANNKKPCILFLDEIDSMGQDRQDVLLDTSGPFIGPDTLSKPSELVSSKAFNSWKNSEAISVESLNLDRLNYDYQTLANPVYGVEQLASQINDPEADLSILDTDSRLESQPGAKKVSAHAVAQLTQLLCLLDGTSQRHVLVIGATNRPQTLDPALTRPGRLNKIFYLDLPSKQKRLDLLKFYSRSRVTGPIDWDYFAKKTVGLSPAHLKAAMNLSALKTAHEMIEKQQTNHNKVYHSEASIEYGIESVSNTQSLAQGFIDQSTKRLNQLSVPLFFDDIGQMNLWQHVSLGSPIRPIVLPACELSGITRTEKLPTKTETQVWNKIPDHIPRVSFPTLYKNVKTLAFQSLQGAGIKTTEHSKNVLSDEKRREGRFRFYQRHRLAWRSAYLLSDPKTINYSLLDNVTIDDHPFVNGFYDSPLLDESSAETLTLFKEYVGRMFRVHVLGSKLLLHSTYAADNPLMFKTEYIYKKVGDTVVRSSGQFTRFSSPTPLYLALLKEEPSLFMPPNNFETTQNKIFSYSLALQRSIAYNANKALMVHLLKDTYQQEHMYDIWNRVKYNANPDKYQKAFVKSVQENFVTRKQFENYLVALSAGKVGEHLMLFYRDALPKFDPLKPRFGRYTYDVSEIGRHELHQMSWLLNIMIEKNLFYSPSVDLSKQLLTTESYSRYRSKYNTSVAAVAANKELWTAFDKSTTILATETDQNPIVNKFLSLFVKPNTTYWWEPNGLDLPSPGNVGSISSWTSLFSTKKQVSVQRMPANLNYDIYRPNVLRTASLLDSPFDAKYLPSSFVESVTKQGETWNQSSLNDTERLSRALLLDTFAKSFYILAGHRELCDHLSYHLVRSGKIQANQLKQICDTFLESAHRERFAQIEKDKEIDEQLGNVQKKK